MRQRWTKEQKADFWAAFVRHRDEGCNIRKAWSRARMDFQAEGKLAPGLRTFANWYRKAMRPQREEAEQADTVEADAAEAANNRTHRTYRTYKENAGTDEAARDAAEVANEEAAGTEAAGEAAEVANEEAEAADAAEPETADDYTRKLEAMLRLYRRRTEADVDAVCDYLLPGLFPADEEGE